MLAAARNEAVALQNKSFPCSARFDSLALMNSRLPTICALLLPLFAQISACIGQEKSGLLNHPLFKHLVGEWKSEGVLKATEGREVKIEEEWTGEMSGEGTFVMKGRRLINDDRQDYVWTFSQNATTGLIEATHEVTGDKDGSKRFEVSISDVDLTMALKYSGESQSSITVKDAFDGKTRDTLNSEVTLTGSNGETTLSGSLKHKRVKKP